MNFEFLGATGSVPGFLKIRQGCYVRARDICLVGVGYTATDAAGALVSTEDAVVVGLGSGENAVFDPCGSVEAAVEMAESLVSALVKAEVMISPAVS